MLTNSCEHEQTKYWNAFHWTSFERCKYNKLVSMLGESAKLAPLTLETLFDDHR